MYNNVVAIVIILVFGAACYALGRAHQPRGPFEEGYQKGVADTTKTMFKTAVRATSANNAAPSRFRPRFPSFGRAAGRAKVATPTIDDGPTEAITPPGTDRTGSIDEDTTVRLLRRHRATDDAA